MKRIGVIYSVAVLMAVLGCQSNPKSSAAPQPQPTSSIAEAPAHQAQKPAAQIPAQQSPSIDTPSLSAKTAKVPPSATSSVSSGEPPSSSAPKPTKEQVALIKKANSPIVGKWLESGADGTKAKMEFDANGTGFGYAIFPPAPSTPIKIRFDYALHDNQLLQRPTSAEIGAKTGDLKAAKMVVDGLNKSFRSVVYKVQTRPRPMKWLDKNTFTLASTYGPSNTFKRAPWSAP